MAISFSRPDPSSPAAVSEATFNTGRRGFDQQEVRDFLRMVAAELARLQERERFLERELRDLQQRLPSASGEAIIDDETATRLIGEEATRILQTAREGANAIRAKGEEGAARLLREAADDAQRQREEADLEASRRRSDAAADAEAELAMAKQQGREMVEEARSYRERVLGELSRRRELARQQIEQLVHGRDRLLQAFERARLVAVDVVAEMTPVGEPDEYVDLSPTTGPVPIMVPAAQAARLADASAIDDSVLRPVDDIEVELEIEPIDPIDPIESIEPAESVEEVAEVVEIVEIAEIVEVGGIDEIDDDDVTEGDVANLFARLRADRPLAAAPDPEHAEAETEAEDESPVEDELEEDTPFARRDAALVPLIVASGRRLKRVLADEQNEVLDRLRQREPVDSVDALIPSAEEQAARYADAITAELIAAAEAGAASISGSADATIDLSPTGPLEAVRASISGDLVEPLRQRLEAAVADGDGDNDAITKRVRGVYREWKTQRIDEQLDDVFRLAFARGAVESLPAGTGVQWVVDPHGPPSPDCEDNALAGSMAIGEAFPSGHHWPPMHPGCRCLLLVTDG